MKRGFTLIEILCVLAIVSIISAISYPDVKRILLKDRLDITASKLVNDLRYAKMHAVTQGTSSVSVIFLKENSSDDYNGYWIYKPSNLSSMELKKVYLTDEIYISRSESTFSITNKIQFNTNGSISPHACSIVLKDRQTGKSIKITLTIGYTRIMIVKR
ncbi:GspH/FimT family pseudopilin [Fonticella tunisiensis]|uniref:Prepilin-type N-terminal cleavage/methylation domain-containing protein n=1 Tax=Fonticella tunisiensis TaxID=1096341 RepID=A0A4R7KSR0_9CLOT|nr:GspH/FimT family pseudopilin [Fonticella tunisiensis]TDT61966.1 prepilin-type N-terminal cleavage/methylation domain-containing protein [Fonticella tunisiensis]